MRFSKMKKLTAFLLIGTIFTGTITEVFAETPGYAETPPEVERLKGDDKYETAALIADKQEYSTAIIVNVDNTSADTLSASGLSGATNSPILFTKQDSIPDATMSRLSGVNKIYIIGGTGSVSTGVENTLKSKGITITRIQGSDRLETSVNVANEIKKYSNSNYVFFVNGYKGEVDATSISPVACKFGAPIILTNGTSTNYPTTDKECYVVGGTDIMSDSIVQSTVSTRLSGSDRFETNKEVINTFLDTDVYGTMVSDNKLKYYIVDGYDIPSGIITATITRDSFFALISNSSNKGFLFDANDIVACGNLSDEVIEQCKNPYPVYGTMFGSWKSQSNNERKLSVDPEAIMLFDNEEPLYSDYENSAFSIKNIDKINKSVIIERKTDTYIEYYRLTKLDDESLKVEISKDNMSDFGQTEYYISNITEEEVITDDYSARAKKKRIVRVCSVRFAGAFFNTAIGFAIGGIAGGVQGFIKKKGIKAAKNIFVRTVTTKLVAIGARPLAVFVGGAVDFASNYFDVGGKVATFIDARDGVRYSNYLDFVYYY